MGNPFDFNRDGRWSTPERVFTFYGVGTLIQGGGGGGSGSGCGCGCGGCILVLIGVVVFLFVLLM